VKSKIKMDVKGFEINVTWWENHVIVEFPKTRTRISKSNSRLVILTMFDVCHEFSRHFMLANDSEGRTCLVYFKNDGSVVQSPGPGKKIEVEEKTRRRVLINIRGHEIRATISTEGFNCLSILLPKEDIGNKFTLHDLCLGLPKEFGFDKRTRRTIIRCKHFC
jgi:hypothetical protein